MANLRRNIEKEISRIKNLNKKIISEYPDKEVCKVTTKGIFTGMRGVVEVVCNTSFVDPYKGLIIKGHTITDLSDKLAEEVFYLLCTGNLPNEQELQLFQKNLYLRSSVPREVWNVLFALPDNTHPMTMFSIAILVLERESIFRSKYEEGLRKKDYWKSTMEDALELIAKVPSIAAAIYRIRYEKDDLIKSYDEDLDWAANYANMLGIDNDEDSFQKLMRLFMVLHCDHEGCNASAFTTRVVGSTLSDIYRSVSSGLNALAGPLHGLANQNVLKFILNLKDDFDDKCPKTQELQKYLRSYLDLGKVIPGYGHAVLRVTDPRFSELQKFADENIKECSLLDIVNKLYKVTPNILKEYGKASSVYPNVDAISGSILYDYGIEHFDYYTVVFGVSRILGFCAQTIIARGVGSGLIRPKSVTSELLLQLLEEKGKK